MKQNDNRSMGALVVSITFGVVVFTALFIQHQSSNKPVIIIPSTEEKTFVSFETSDVDSNVSGIDVIKEEIAVSEPPGMISFSKAFAISREALGSGQSFTWKGNQYSTNTVEEAAALEKQKQSGIELTNIQDSLDNALTQAVTPFR